MQASASFHTTTEPKLTCIMWTSERVIPNLQGFVGGFGWVGHYRGVEFPPKSLQSAALSFPNFLRRYPSVDCCYRNQQQTLGVSRTHQRLKLLKLASRGGPGRRLILEGKQHTHHTSSLRVQLRLWSNLMSGHQIGSRRSPNWHDEMDDEWPVVKVFQPTLLSSGRICLVSSNANR